LKKTKAIVIQIFVVMMSTESESAEIISTLQEMKFALDAACAAGDEAIAARSAATMKSITHIEN
jgi:hypothetical protein